MRMQRGDVWAVYNVGGPVQLPEEGTRSPSVVRCAELDAASSLSLRHTFTAAQCANLNTGSSTLEG